MDNSRMIHTQRKFLFLCMLSNIFLNVGVAFGNLEEEWVQGKYGIPISTRR